MVRGPGRIEFQLCCFLGLEVPNIVLFFMQIKLDLKEKVNFSTYVLKMAFLKKSENLHNSRHQLWTIKDQSCNFIYIYF